MKHEGTPIFPQTGQQMLIEFFGKQMFHQFMNSFEHTVPFHLASMSSKQRMVLPNIPFPGMLLYFHAGNDV